MYTVKTSKGAHVATFATIDEARAAIRDTSNVIHYSAAAVAAENGEALADESEESDIGGRA